MEKIIIIYKKPDKLPEVMKIECTLENCQRLVRGPIEILRVAPDVACVFNETGLIRRLTPNIWLGERAICGPLFFCGVQEMRDGKYFCNIPLEVCGTICSWLFELEAEYQRKWGNEE